MTDPYANGSEDYAAQFHRMERAERNVNFLLATERSLRLEIANLRHALERLGSSEAMTHSFSVDTSPAARELIARIDFARAALGTLPTSNQTEPKA